MPKADADTPGNGCHIHFSLWSTADGNAYSANQVTRRKAWMTQLVSQSAPAGTLYAFTVARNDGIVRLIAALRVELS
jgi:glutamine synthetase